MKYPLRVNIKKKYKKKKLKTLLDIKEYYKNKQKLQ